MGLLEGKKRVTDCLFLIIGSTRQEPTGQRHRAVSPRERRLLENRHEIPRLFSLRTTKNGNRLAHRLAASVGVPSTGHEEAAGQETELALR